METTVAYLQRVQRYSRIVDYWRVSTLAKTGVAKVNTAHFGMNRRNLNFSMM